MNDFATMVRVAIAFQFSFCSFLRVLSSLLGYLRAL